MKELLPQLRKLKEDRGAMAALRQGLNTRTCWRTWPYIPQYLGHDRTRLIAQTVAAAYGYHSQARQEGNIGTTCRFLAGEGGSGLSTFRGRFERLLMADSIEELCQHLRSVILAAAQKGAPLDFAQLIDDLWYWGDRTRLRWAAEFYRKED